MLCNSFIASLLVDRISASRVSCTRSRLGSEAADLPLLQEREVKKVTLVVISGDRGLCGSYNSYMIKKAEKRYNELTAKGIEVDMVMVGKKVSY